MAEYDNGPRPLPWPLLHPLVGSRTVEDDDLESPSFFVWPEDPNERTLVPFWLSLNEYNILGSTIDVGSDVAFGIDALRVVWLWLRNMRVNVPICDAVNECITNNPTTINNIVAQLILNSTYNDYITNLILTVSPGGGGNVYPPRPTIATPDPLCNAAAYLADQLRLLIEDIYDDLETLTADEVLASLLGVLGWRSGPLYQLIGLLETNDKTAMLAAFDAAKADLICQLKNAELDQAPVVAWIDTTYPSPSVIGDALRLGVQASADEGKWSQWIAVGALKTGYDCDDCSPEICGDVTQDQGIWQPVASDLATWIEGEGYARGSLQPGRIYIGTDETFTGEYILVSFSEPASGHIWLYSTDFSQQPVTNRYEFSNAADVMVGPIEVTIGLVVDFGRDVDNPNLPLPETVRIKALCPTPE